MLTFKVADRDAEIVLQGDKEGMEPCGLEHFAKVRLCYFLSSFSWLEPCRSHCRADWPLVGWRWHIGRRERWWWWHVCGCGYVCRDVCGHVCRSIASPAL